VETAGRAGRVVCGWGAEHWEDMGVAYEVTQIMNQSSMCNAAWKLNWLLDCLHGILRSKKLSV
jgi:hypothetical protein